MHPQVFELPLIFDLGATAAFALTGVFAGVRRGYDLVGVFFLSAATALGGGLMRDGILGRGIPVALRNPDYIVAVAAACVAGLFLTRRMKRFERWIMVGDALGLATYTMVGAQMALRSGLSVAAALLVGVINGIGGGLLRDVLSREEPLVFKPGEFYALVALAGEVGFVFLVIVLGVDMKTAAIAGIALTLLLRYLTLRFKWRTRPFAPPS